jgi:Flp pilus assembly CpaF family ATPase
VVIPDITRPWAVNIRKFQPAHRDLGRVVAAGSLAPRAAVLLRDAMIAGQSVLVSATLTPERRRSSALSSLRVRPNTAS